MTNPPDWFAPLSNRLIDSVAAESRPDVEVRLGELQDRISAVSPAEQARIRNAFAGKCIGSAFASVEAELSGLSYAGDIGSAIAGARDALEATFEVLAELQAKANDLRRIANITWRASSEASTAARLLDRAEDTAAQLAMITGLPPVVAAWAVAAHAKMAMIQVAEISARAGRVADMAWGAVQRVIDMIRRQAFAAVDAVMRIADEAADAIARGQQAVGTAYAQLVTDLELSVDDVAPVVVAV